MNQWREFTDEELIGAMESENSCFSEGLPGLIAASLITLLEEFRGRGLNESEYQHWTRHWDDVVHQYR